jgi:hypothetical protein
MEKVITLVLTETGPFFKLVVLIVLVTICVNITVAMINGNRALRTRIPM